MIQLPHLKNVVERDEMDSNRADSPLMQAADALVIDNSQLTKEQQFNVILNLANERIN